MGLNTGYSNSKAGIGNVVGSALGLPIKVVELPIQFAGGAVKGAGNLVGGATNAVGGLASGLGNAAGGVVGGVGNLAGNVVGGVGHALEGIPIIGKPIGGLLSGVGNAVSGVTGGLGKAVGTVASLPGQIVSGVGGAIGGATGGGMDFGKEISGLQSTLGVGGGAKGPVLSEATIPGWGNMSDDQRAYYQKRLGDAMKKDSEKTAEELIRSYEASAEGYLNPGNGPFALPGERQRAAMDKAQSEYDHTSSLAQTDRDLRERKDLNDLLASYRKKKFMGVMPWLRRTFLGEE